MRFPLLVSILFASAASSWAEPLSPPPLSLPKAAAIAQATLESLKLPPEYFLKSISYRPPSDVEPQACYLAAFEPARMRRVIVDATPEPRKIKSIKVLMDGSASVIEEELPMRRIIRVEKK